MKYYRRFETCPIYRQKLLNCMEKNGINISIFGGYIHVEDAYILKQLYKSAIPYEWMIILDLAWGIKYKEYSRKYNKPDVYEKVVRPSVDRTKFRAQLSKRGMTIDSTSEQMGIGEDTLNHYLKRNELPRKWVKWLQEELNMPYELYKGEEKE